jgi:hypothetical protein
MERNGMNLFRIEKTKVNEEEKFVIVCGKYRASKMEFKTKENAEDYIANMIDWDMLVTIVGQLSEHIAEKKVNEMLNNNCGQGNRRN